MSAGSKGIQPIYENQVISRIMQLLFEPIAHFVTNSESSSQKSLRNHIGSPVDYRLPLSPYLIHPLHPK